MSKLPYGSFVINDLRGGRNGADPALSLHETQCAEALNVDWWQGTLANKRNGAAAAGTTFSSGGPFTGVISSAVRHVPGVDETAAELWAFDAAATPVVGRLAASTQFAAPTVVDALGNSAAGMNVAGVSFDGKLFLCYDSAQNRLHCWDGTRVRRVGLATPDPPTAADGAAGALSFTRYYRIRTVELSGSTVVRRSEASTSISHTIAAKAGVTVTRPTLPTNEHETHWEVEYADASSGPWYRAAQVATGTATYSDTASSISTTNLSNSAEIHYPPPSAKFIVAADARLVMAGNHETSGGYVTPKNNRVWWTPPIGALDVGDSERIPANYHKDVEEPVTGLGGPMGGIVFVFSYRDFWRFMPTGQTGANAFERFRNGSGIGCPFPNTITLMEDENGQACIGWLSHKGPYRYGVRGLQYMGNDCEDVWSTVNLAASNKAAHAVYHADKHQWWVYVATGSANDPNVKMVFDTRLGFSQADSVVFGWSKHTGESCDARCSVMFSNTIGATMSRDLKPYIGQADAATRLWKADSGTNDAGTNFQAYVDTKEYAPAGLGTNCAIHAPYLIAEAATGVTITVSAREDHGRGSSSSEVSLTAEGSETHVQRKLEGLQTAGVGTVRYRIGDAAAADNGWTLDALVAAIKEQERR